MSNLKQDWLNPKLKLMTIHFNKAALKLTDDEKWAKAQEAMGYVFELGRQGHAINTAWYPSVNPRDFTFVFEGTEAVERELRKKFPDATMEPGGKVFGKMMPRGFKR